MAKLPASILKGLNKSSLRHWLVLFFLALALPSAVLIQQALTRLDMDVFHQHRSLAEELIARIDLRFQQLINEEEKRAFTDYAFLNIAGDPSASFLQRSPLSNYPPESFIPGMIGYFQVDAQGALLTPLLPQPARSAKRYGISDKEFDQRLALQNTIQHVLAENRLLTSPRRIQVSSIVNKTGNQKITSNEQDSSESGQTNSAGYHQPNYPAKKVKPRIENNTSVIDSVKRVVESEQKDTRGKDETTIPGQAGFDQLNQLALRTKQSTKKSERKTLGRVSDLKLDDRYQTQHTPNHQKPAHILEQTQFKLEKRARRELNTLPESVLKNQLESSDSAIQKTPLPATTGLNGRSDNSLAEEQSDTPIRIRTFESEIDPFEFSLLDSQHFVLFRKVWRNQQRYIQGMLVDQHAFLNGMIETSFQPSVLALTSSVLVAYRGDVFSIYNGQTVNNYFSRSQDLQGALLYQNHLSTPFNELELIFSINSLPATTGSYVIGWTATLLFLILFCGLFLIYRAIVKQIELTNQQQNFVSAVSHELRTPLTSIRMYSEILQEGWASQEKQQHYYTYIFDESERLSRLINNVLQLARLSRNEHRGDIKNLTIPELLNIIQSKVIAQAEHAGFILNINNETETQHSTILVDSDWFAQIIINLVDNAIKFSANANKKIIDIGCKQLTPNKIQFSVRDYGSGIPKPHIKKIFQLFYRTETELTRETVGTGIGLALVQQLTEAMQGHVEVVNRSPGVEFMVFFPTSIQTHN